MERPREDDHKYRRLGDGGKPKRDGTIEAPQAICWKCYANNKIKRSKQLYMSLTIIGLLYYW